MSLSDSALRAITGSRSDAGAPLTTGPQFDARTRLLLEGPIVATLLRLANLMRLAMAAGGGWLARRWSGDLSYVFLALSAALAAFGLINAGAVASGAWFGRVGWPRLRPGRLRRR
jgi:hypothetical protein